MFAGREGESSGFLVSPLSDSNKRNSFVWLILRLAHVMRVPIMCVFRAWTVVLQLWKVGSFAGAQELRSANVNAGFPAPFLS